MNQKNYFLVSGVIFLVIAVLHVLRLFYGWDAAFNGWLVPMWVSWVALVVAGYLGYTGITHGK